METASPVMNIAANKLAQKWLGEIRAQLESLPAATQAGCWLSILDRCALKRPNLSASVTKGQMVEKFEQRVKSLNEKYSSRWKWPTYYVEFAQDCGMTLAPAVDDSAGRFAVAVQKHIDYDRCNLAQLLKVKEKIVDAILIFHGHRRATLTGAEALEGTRLADEWISKMEAEIVDVELKGRERFWEKVALTANTWNK